MDRRAAERRATVAALVASGLVGSSLLMPGLAAAAVPAFPDNVVVFPDRDFVTIEGYQDHIGETAIVEVKRAGQVVGSAKGVVEAGDVAFEVNHPGGYCWGAGTGLNVTPNIVAGDVVVDHLPGRRPVGDTTVRRAAVTKDMELERQHADRHGRRSAPARTRPRSSSASSTRTSSATAVGKRDIRAVPGPLTPAPKGGYSSSLIVDRRHLHRDLPVRRPGGRRDRVQGRAR